MESEKEIKKSSLAPPVPTPSSVCTPNQPKPANLLLPAGSATGNPRNKVALRKGRSLVDWVRLSRTTSDLAGNKGKLLAVTSKELAKHNTLSDAWTSLRGRVYNITPYLEFHPGGEEEIMRGAGTDSTNLFNEIHKWVNFESMLEKCLVGYLVEDTTTSCSALRRPHKALLPFLSGINRLLEGSSCAAAAKPRSNAVGVDNKLPPIVARQRPSFDWYQSEACVSISIYTHWSAVTVHHCSLSIDELVLTISVIVLSDCYTISVELQHAVTSENIRVSMSGGRSGKLEVILPKGEMGVRWSSLGRHLPLNDTLVPILDRPKMYHQCCIIGKRRLTHDTFLFTVQCPKHVLISVPPGYHNFLRIPQSGLSKPYTPVPASLDVEAWGSCTHLISGNCLYYVIKVYSDGVMSTALDNIGVSADDSGDDAGVIEVSLAEGDHLPHLSWGPGEGLDPPLSDVALLAAGTGITPMLALLLQCINLKRRVRLVYFNKTEEDISWREELEELGLKHESLVRVNHVLSAAPSSWKGLRGRVSAELLEPLLPVADGHGSVFLAACGPKAFTELALSSFQELGYLRDEYHAFVG